MATTPFWGKNARAWDRPEIGGRPLPGTVLLKSGAGLEQRTQRGKASGKDGGGTTTRGLDFTDFTFEGELTTEAHNAAWDALVPVLMSKRSAEQRVTVSVYHPTLARMGIGYCLVKKVWEMPPHAGGPCIYTITCEAQIAPKEAKAIRTTAKNAPGSPIQLAVPVIELGVAADARLITDYVRPPAAKLTK